MDTKTFGSMGGNARTLALTSKQRSEAAKKAAQMRWGKKQLKLPIQGLKAIAESKTTPIKIGEFEIPCAVLEDGTRVLSRTAIENALTIKDKGKVREAGNLPTFLAPKCLEPFIDVELSTPAQTPIEYIPMTGSKALGIQAELLPKICNVWLSARNAGVLSQSQMRIALQAELLVRAFAQVGIIALVDEATGYQKQKNEYQKILEAYIEKELRPWLMTFEDNYYKQIYRLLGWNWDAFKGNKKNHPSYIGKLTNRIIYEKLPPGVLEALKELNPKNDKGNRGNRFHQFLTENIGYRHLIKHITAVTTIMEMYPDGAWAEALHKIDTRFPTQRLPMQLELNLK